MRRCAIKVSWAADVEMNAVCVLAGSDPMASRSSSQWLAVHFEQAECWSHSIATPHVTPLGEAEQWALMIFWDLIRNCSLIPIRSPWEISSWMVHSIKGNWRKWAALIYSGASDAIHRKVASSMASSEVCNWWMLIVEYNPHPSLLRKKSWRLVSKLNNYWLSS